VLVGLAAAGAAVAWAPGADALAWVAWIVAALVIFFIGRRGPAPALLPACLAASLAPPVAPLPLAVLDRPLARPPAVPGRLFERIRVDTHALPGAVPPQEPTTRAVMRRISAELWAISGALAGVPYAFDRDPDGSYSDPDRVVRRALDQRPWPERAPILRRAGVSHVVTDEALAAPYRQTRVLSAVHGVRLYALDGAAPSVRLAAGRFVSLRESASSLRAEVETSGPDRLVWSRSYFGAWRATVDGAAVEVTLADGHVVGVPVPAGRHLVEVTWPATPLAAGGALFATGVLAGLLARRR
jgi:hypothetical protein